MPPQDIATLCQPMAVNATTAPDRSDMEDRNALLYIVVTLLFYSMGIVIGIITYLKREQAEMEEDKMFEVYLHMKREPFNLHKQERVNQMAIYLKQIEDRKAEMEKTHKWKGSGSEQQLHHPLCPHLQLQLQREQHSESQLFPEARKFSTSLMCPVCHGGAQFNDHGESHHLQPMTSRSRHSSGKETPAGTPALLCSLTLNVCEPFLSPETLPKAALPFKPPTPRERRQGSLGYHSQAEAKRGDPLEHCAFENVISSSSNTRQSELQRPKSEPVNEAAYPSGGFYEQFNKGDKSDIKADEGATIVELQPLGYITGGYEETNNDVFQNHISQFSIPQKNAVITQLNESNKDTFPNSRPLHKPSLMLSFTSTSPPLLSRALSIDHVPPSTGRNKLKRQVSLHNERNLPSTHKPFRLSRQPTENIEEEDSKMLILPENGVSTVCETGETDKSSEASTFPVYTGSTDQLNIEEHNDQPSSNPSLKSHDRAPIGAIPVSHSDPLLPKKPLSSPKSPAKVVFSSKPRDARPKIFSLFENPAAGSKDNIYDDNSSTASPDQPRGRLRKTILEAWRDSSSQSADIPELTKLHKTAPSYTSFPSFLKGKGIQSQSEVVRSTFPRAPGPREERRGALFLSQKSLLHSSTASPRSGGDSRTLQQHRLGYSHKSGLTRQTTIDFPPRTSPDQTIASLKPFLDSDHPQSSEDSSGITPLESTHRDPVSRIPKLSRAQTVDTSSLFQK